MLASPSLLRSAQPAFTLQLTTTLSSRLASFVSLSSPPSASRLHFLVSDPACNPVAISCSRTRPLEETSEQHVRLQVSVYSTLTPTIYTQMNPTFRFCSLKGLRSPHSLLPPAPLPPLAPLKALGVVLYPLTALTPVPCTTSLLGSGTGLNVGTPLSWSLSSGRRRNLDWEAPPAEETLQIVAGDPGSEGVGGLPRTKALLGGWVG